MSFPKYGIAFYEKSVVKTFEVYNTKKAFRNKLKEILRDEEEIDVSKLDRMKTIKLIRLVNKHRNYTDGDFWNLMYEFSGSEGYLLNGPEYQEDEEEE